MTGNGTPEDSNVPQGEALHAFVEATLKRDTYAVHRVRETLLPDLGPEGVVDAAGIIANFERMNRIADAAGLELDAPVRVLSAEMRDELGLETFTAAEHTPSSSALEKTFAHYVVPILAWVLNKMRKRGK